MTSSTNTAPPTLDQVLEGMSTSLNGTLPPSVRLAATVMPDLVLHHAQDSGYAMPKEGGALSNETRTLIYLGVALATGSHACIDAMMNKAQAQHLDEAKILETVKIARFAEATRVFGNAEHVFSMLASARNSEELN
ncbi:MAG: carboxymuconolactone decarboxylase family protein [Guyparkeria sp.]